jgi:hypothetical protein
MCHLASLNKRNNVSGRDVSDGEKAALPESSEMWITT